MLELGDTSTLINVRCVAGLKQLNTVSLIVLGFVRFGIIFPALFPASLIPAFLCPFLPFSSPCLILSLRLRSLFPVISLLLVFTAFGLLEILPPFETLSLALRK